MMQHTAGGSARSKLGGCIIDILDSPDIRSSSTTSHHHHSHMDCVGPGQTRTDQDTAGLTERRVQCSGHHTIQSVFPSDWFLHSWTGGLVDTTGMTGLPLHQHHQSLCHCFIQMSTLSTIPVFSDGKHFSWWLVGALWSRCSR